MSYLSPCYMPGWHASVFLHWSGLHRGPSHGQSGHHHAVLHIFRSQRGRKDGNIMAKMEGWYYNTFVHGDWCDREVACEQTLSSAWPPYVSQRSWHVKQKKGPIISWQLFHSQSYNLWTKSCPSEDLKPKHRNYHPSISENKLTYETILHYECSDAVHKVLCPNELIWLSTFVTSVATESLGCAETRNVCVFYCVSWTLRQF